MNVMPVLSAIFVTGPSLLKSGLVKILGFFTSGWYSYIGMFTFVLWDHRDTLVQGRFRQTFVDIGLKLGRADTVVAENLNFLIEGASGLAYVTTLVQVLAALFTVLWFLRTIATIITFVFSDLVPEILVYGFAILLWFLSVVYVEGRFPLATLELILNLPEILDVNRVNPFSGASNQTEYIIDI